METTSKDNCERIQNKLSGFCDDSREDNTMTFGPYDQDNMTSNVRTTSEDNVGNV